MVSRALAASRRPGVSRSAEDRGQSPQPCEAGGQRTAARALALLPAALLRPSELASADAALAGGRLHLPAATSSGFTVPARTIPLGAAARTVLGAGDGTLAAALGLGPADRAGLPRVLRRAYTIHRRGGPATVEQLWADLVAAVTTAAQGPAGPRATLAYAGLPTAVDRTAAADLDAVAGTLDGAITAAGFATTPADATACAA